MNEVSPIESLIPLVLRLPFAVAPERQSELDSIFQKYGLSVSIDSTTQEFEVHVLFGAIRISVAALERIWAYCYGYVYIAWLIQRSPQGQEITLSGDADKAWRLIKWARAADVDKQYTNWPLDLPTPDSDQTKDGNIKPSTEVFLVACGWILLHEIGHVVLGHGKNLTPSPDESVAMELEADNWASSWILDRWKQYKDDIRVFQKRTLGITFGIGLQSVFELYREKEKSLTHPNIADRLLAFLDRHVPEKGVVKATPEELAWLAAIAILQTHISNTTRSFTMNPIHNGFRDFVMDLKQQL